MWSTYRIIIPLATLVLGLCLGAPVDDSEVELIEPLSSQVEDPTEDSFFNVGRSPIFVIHGSFPQSFPGIRQPQDLFKTDFLPASFRDLFGFRESSNNDKESVDVEIIPPPPSFAQRDDDEDKSKPFCGLFCKLFADLDKQLSFINRGYAQGGQHPLSFFPGFVPVNKGNSTYTEKVLPDGSIVRVNQTTFSDSDDNGNAVFFHSATHILDGGSGGDEEASEDKKSEMADDESPEGPTKKDEKPAIVQIIPDEDIGFKLPEDFDPNLNEVSEDLEIKRSKRSSRDESDSLPSYGGSASGNSETLIPIGNSDVRVNDILTESGKRGSLVQIDPDSELIVEVGDGSVVPLEDFQGTQSSSEWSQQSQNNENTWSQRQQRTLSNIVFPHH